MNKGVILDLMNKYLADCLNIEEKLDLANRIRSISNDEFLEILTQLEVPEKSSIRLSSLEVNQRLDTLFENLLLDERVSAPAEVIPLKRTKNLFPLWFTVAAACLICLLGFLYVLTTLNFKETTLVEHTQDVEPAKSIALIVLENGDQIKVDSATEGLVYSKEGLHVYINKEGEVVYKDTNVRNDMPQYLSVHTPKGGHTKLKLNDGTVIELSAASSIRYPMSFGTDKREVYVEGEAFFKVNPEKNRPFIVHSKRQDIEVLGTSFNLTSTDDFAKTLLLEGSVRIISGKDSYLLKPGQQAMVTDSVEIHDLKPEVVKNWNVAKFVFDNSSFKEILREVENWYDVKMVFYDSNFVNIEFSGTVSRSVQLSDLLKVLEINTGYKFEIEGRRVLVRRY